jgi:hypothetical protein
VNGLVAYYPFNGNANDESGNGYNGVNNGAIPAKDRFGNDNKAYSFDGVSSKIDIPNSANLILNKTFTLSVWEKTSQFYTWNVQANLFFGKGQDRTAGFFGIGQQDFYGIPGAPAYKLIFAVRFKEQLPSVQIPSSYLLSNTNAQKDTWYNIVGVSDENSIKIYVNGVLENSANTASLTFLTSAENAGIGYHPYMSYPFEYYHNGSIDDIRIYNRALSGNEVLALYHEGGW